MKKKILILSLIIAVGACRLEDAATVRQNNADSAIAKETTKDTQPNAKQSSPKPAFDGEIIGCSVETLGNDAKLTVNLKKPNGGYLAVKREAKNPDYYLLSAPADSQEHKFAAAADTLPLWTVETLKSLSRIELDMFAARAVNLSKINKQGEGHGERIFNRSGWYEILLSDENFEQDDPAITGKCRIYFDKSKTIAANVQSPTANDVEIINWNSDADDLTFQTKITLKNGQPTTFSLNGSRRFKQNNVETANECFFAVEKDKNDSVWETSNGKTLITGKDELGTTFQMTIKKTKAGFLIDTAAAAASCSNVGMPGDILLTKIGNKYNGKFIAR